MKEELDSRKAIIFVPGFDHTEKDYYINHYLAVGLMTRLETTKVTLEHQEVKIAGQTGKSFCYHSNNGKKYIDVYEVYWADLARDLNNETIRYRVFRGIYLLIYWLIGLRKIRTVSKVLFFQMIAVLFLIVAWEYSTVAMALTAVANDSNVLGFNIPNGLAEQLGIVGKALHGWQLWLIISAILSFLPISANLIVNILDFMARYAQDDTDKDFGGLRDRLRCRIQSVLDDAFNALNDEKEPRYREITVLAHSLGVPVATDLLGDYKNQSGKSVNFITLGSPLQILASISTWIQPEIVKCLNNDFIDNWIDFYSDKDWLCSKVPVPNETNPNRFESRKTLLKSSLLKQISRGCHCDYFFEKEVLQKLIE